MQPPGVGSHRFYTRGQALFDREQDFDRQEHSPPRDHRNEDQEIRESNREMVIGKEHMAQDL